MVKTVIFDMDGVIVDTEPVHFLAYQKHFADLGIVVTDDLYSTFTGNSTRNIYQKLKEKFALEEDVEKLVMIKRAIFNDAFDTKEDLFLLPGVGELIADLHAKGMNLILASSSAHVTIKRIFDRFGLHRYFSHIVSGEEFPRSKPDPAIFLRAVELSGHQAWECIVIEDSTNGIRAAKSAGLYCIGYDSKNSKMQDLSLADMTISHFSELSFDRIRNLT